jgi:hypothetical protein
MGQGGRERGRTVEGLYCKRPIQCLASSEILTPPPPLTARRGEDTLAGWRRGGGSTVRKTPDTALYSIYVKYFVGWTKKRHLYARKFLMSSIWGVETLTKRFVSVNNRKSTGGRYNNKITYQTWDFLVNLRYIRLGTHTRIYYLFLASWECIDESVDWLSVILRCLIFM